MELASLSVGEDIRAGAAWSGCRAARYACALAGTYLVASTLYIVYSSRVAASLVRDVDALERIEVYKGIGFVAITSTLLFVGSLWGFRRLERANSEAVRREISLLANERRITAGVLAASIAHDVNNLLMVLQAELDELDPKRGAPEARARWDEVFERIVALNRRLVRANRGVAGAPVSIDAAELLRQAVDGVRPHESVRHTQLVVEAESAPLATQPVLVQQIVGNLLLNAGEATAGKGRIRLQGGCRDGGYTIEVHDDGPGVPEARREALFDALETTKPDGNGLGLYSARRSAEALGGSLEVGASEALGGALFRVHLPLGAREDEAQREGPAKG